MKTIGILMKVLVSVKYFFYLLYHKVIENSENHVNRMKNVYQIDQNGQNEPKLTKVVGTQLTKMDQNEHS